MHPYIHAEKTPDKLAFVLADSGETLTYRELDDASNQFAQLLRHHGLKPGDRAGVMMKNAREFPIIYWGAQRSGILLALLSSHLKPAEAAYILNDSGARLLFTSSELGAVPSELAADRANLIPNIEQIFDISETPLAGLTPLRSALEVMPTTPVADETAGYHLLYSSGTTGRPKGIMHKFDSGPIEKLSPSEGGTFMYQKFDPLVVFNAGPVYHGAPLSSLLVSHRLGGTFVSLKKFDAYQTLKAIQDYGVVTAQFVPTMFVRMLALSEDVRKNIDISSLQFVLHAAAPCPVGIKQQMIDWFGPIVDEYYGATENIGSTYIRAEDWLKKQGSVGRTSQGAIHICHDDGNELPSGESGLIYFEQEAGRESNYLNDPGKTAKMRHPQHDNWLTVGDIGYVDEEEFLFLTDRKDFTIISGGVNIYPQMIEDAIILHPRVMDVAVIGVPNPEYGEEVKAIVQPKVWAEEGAELEAEIRDWCKSKISSVISPKSYQFVEELPRLPSGKLAKHELRRLYGADKPWI